MIEKKVVSQLIEEKLASSSNYLVDVVIKPGNLIVVEIDNDEAVSIDDCAELSRYLEEHLDRDVEDYELEVGLRRHYFSFQGTSPIRQEHRKRGGDAVEKRLEADRCVEICRRERCGCLCREEGETGRR